MTDIYAKKFEADMLGQLAQKGWYFAGDPRRGRAWNYAGGQVSRLTHSLSASAHGYNANWSVQPTLVQIRNNSRLLDRDNPYVHGFFKKLGINCVGENGIALQCQAKMWGRDKDGKPVEKFDVAGNKVVEAGFKEWGREGNCDVTGKLSLIDFLVLTLETWARDGEVLIRKRKGWKGNKWRYALQLIEADHLDEFYNETLPNGNRIIMSVEIDPEGRPVAYHLLKQHPGDTLWNYGNRERVRVPAEEIEHIYTVSRINQSRGVPWIHASLLEFHRIGSFREAAIINAQVGASKMGVWEELEEGSGAERQKAIEGQATGQETDSAGNQAYVQDAVPGAFDFAPRGYKLATFDPKYPANEFGPFNKVMLQGAMAGILASYYTHTGDLDSANFSNIRSGKIDERDMYKCITWALIRKTLDKFIYADWLEMSLLSGALVFPSGSALPPAVLDKFNKPQWGPRGFDWVDPKNDIEAALLEVNNGLNFRGNLVAERHGGNMDFRDICEKLAEEKAIADEFKLDFSSGKTEAAFKEAIKGKKKPDAKPGESGDAEQVQDPEEDEE